MFVACNPETINKFSPNKFSQTNNNIVAAPVVQSASMDSGRLILHGKNLDTIQTISIVGGANHQCEFKNQQGKRCQERRNLQFDHVKPFALGGDGSAQNIQMLCFAHNQRRAKLTFARI